MQQFTILCAAKYLSLFTGLFLSFQILATEVLSHPADILYILSKDSAFYHDFTDNVQRHINSSNNNTRHRRSLRLTTSDPRIQHELSKGYRLVVSIGSEALKTVSENGYRGQVLSALTPELSVRQYSHDKKYSVLYANHPISRYLRLIKLAMPESRRVGVLLGPSSFIYINRIKDTASTLGLHLYIKKVEQTRQVSHQIGQLAAEVDVILAIPDPVVHNSRTARSILYAGYRHNIPVVAYSSSYLEAGALLSLYSSPDQLAQDTAQYVIDILDSVPLHKVIQAYPASFSIGINRNVARSLGREEIDEIRLKNLLTLNRPNKK